MDDAVGGLDQLLTLAEELGPAEKAPPKAERDANLIEIARTKTKDEAMAALDTWRERYPSVAAKLEPIDILVDGMRGPSSIWYRIRINLQHIPDDERPKQEPLIADYSPWEGYSGPQWLHR
jgi:bifunctional non-homologous end joining protein LigD